jgi:peptide subunit release factor 1 (eRF1)
MTQNNWHALLSHSLRPNRSVLSVYLNVDQSRQANLNRGFETRFKDLLFRLKNTIQDSPELQRFRTSEHRMADFLAAYEPKADTVVLFFDASENFFWSSELNIAMQDMARWDRDFFLRPLAAATDDFERYGIVLVDRANARLFTVFLGGIEEVLRVEFDPAKVRRLKSVGTGWSSPSQVEGKADEQVRKNLRQVVREIDALVRSTNINRLVLAGTSEITALLQDLLPKRLALRVIETVDMDVDAPPKHVLETTRGLTERYERSSEEQLVKEVSTSAARMGHAVVGLSNTLKKINEARVWQLIYSEDFQSPGLECLKCAALFPIPKEACTYCGSPVGRVDDIVEKAVERALRKQARIEVVRGEAAALLDNCGGIAAFLKARTRIVEA